MVRSNFGFPFSKTIRVEFASHGADHLCLIFFKAGVRVGSFCAEFPGRCDYLSEKTGQSLPVSNLSEALRMATAE